MWTSREQQGDIKKSSYVNTARIRGKQQNCKEYRSLQENWRYHRNTLCKYGHNKGQKNQRQTKADEIKKRQEECTEELYKNGHNDRDRNDAGATHVKPDILEYEVKWALGSITMNNVRRGDGIPVELFKNPK